MGAAFVMACLLFSSPRTVAAQTATPTPTPTPDAEGVFTDTFDVDTQGWTSVHPETVVSWNDEIVLGGLLSYRADGVLSAVGTGYLQDGPVIVKEVFLQPGTYRIKYIAASGDWGCTFAIGCGITWYLNSSYYYDLGTISLNNAWFGYKQTGTFDITYPGNYQIEANVRGAETLYFDYIELVAVSVTPPTVGPGTPTPIPTNSQATPIPSATPFCVEPTATPAAPPFSVTPSPAMWGYYDPFDYSLSYIWQVIGNGTFPYIGLTSSGGRPIVGGSNVYGATLGSVNIPYTADGDISGRKALVFHPTTDTLPSTFYVDFWSRSQVLSAGESAYIEVWVYTNSWAKHSEYALSSVYSPHHVTIAVVGVQSVGFVTRISPERGGTNTDAFFDDFSIYDDVANAPRCDNTAVINNVGGDSSGANGARPGEIVFEWPADKPCPPSTITASDNFWGGLLVQLTLFLDTVFAMAPYHQSGVLTSAVNNQVSSPVITYVVLVSALVDFKPYFIVGSIIIISESFRALWSIWLMIKRSIPFLN